MKTVTILDIGGGDNFSFDAVGLPSFGFIQDPIGYNTAHASHQRGRLRTDSAPRHAVQCGRAGEFRLAGCAA